MKRHAGVDQSQVTFENFVFVVLGSVIGSWKADTRKFKSNHIDAPQLI